MAESNRYYGKPNSGFGRGRGFNSNDRRSSQPQPQKDMSAWENERMQNVPSQTQPVPNQRPQPASNANNKIRARSLFNSNTRAPKEEKFPATPIENYKIAPIEKFADVKDIEYDPPDYNPTPNAYVVVIFLGDVFLPGILATCYSIIKHDTTGNDIVVMVTSKYKDEQFNVSLKCINIIKKLNNFNKNRVVIAHIPYISIETNDGTMTLNTKLMYGNWFYIAYTKWNALNLTKYKKVLMIDADAILFRDVGELFNLQTPAAPFMYDKFVKNLNADEKKYVFESYFNIKGTENIIGSDGTYEHGKKMPLKIMTDKLFTKNLVFVASTILLTPDTATFQEYINMLLNKTSSNKIHDLPCVSMFDEKTLAYFFTYKTNPEQFTIIHQRFNAYTTKTALLPNDKPYINHYVNSKPWDTYDVDNKKIKPIITDTQTFHWDDIKCWYKLVSDSILHNVLTLEDYISLIPDNTPNRNKEIFTERVKLMQDTNVEKLGSSYKQGRPMDKDPAWQQDYIGYRNIKNNTFCDLSDSFRPPGAIAGPSSTGPSSASSSAGPSSSLATGGGTNRRTQKPKSKSTKSRSRSRSHKSTRPKTTKTKTKSRSRSRSRTTTRPKTTKTKTTKPKTQKTESNLSFDLIEW